MPQKKRPRTATPAVAEFRRPKYGVRSSVRVSNSPLQPRQLAAHFLGLEDFGGVGGIRTTARRMLGGMLSNRRQPDGDVTPFPSLLGDRRVSMG
jgi:hypothetical protein